MQPVTPIDWAAWISALATLGQLIFAVVAVLYVIREYHRQAPSIGILEAESGNKGTVGPISVKLVNRSNRELEPEKVYLEQYFKRTKDNWKTFNWFPKVRLEMTTNTPSMSPGQKSVWSLYSAPYHVYRKKPVVKVVVNGRIIAKKKCLVPPSF